ncbi:hypothetical protein SM124_15755 [Bacillus sp. 31A1R]|uniref:Uncharacterized protein n=1 Tax=Robertmurraya mangrovi TaxID=3098077 RepID=A0ABU5J183_9BACI|nr:hypothetical protein [Bacillus sp. 31A1R]MDZ5473173.1 hypothetical protein [Bacillus sp. 31A1R]
MYRFSIDKEDWILRFSPNVHIEKDVKQAIVSSIIHMGKDLSTFPHGESFLLFTESLGVIIFNIERVPSLILKLVTVVPKDQWYKQNGSIIEKYKG